MEGIEVRSFSDVLDLYRNSEIDRIIITVGKVMEIVELCLQNQIKLCDLFYFKRSHKSVLPVSELYADTCTSQDGEELYLRKRYAHKENGTYVDVGANHPMRFSNTWWAYMKGWRGLNIEPDGINYKLLELVRKEDININCGIASKNSQMRYYELQESALNTFAYDELDEKKREQIIGIHYVPVRRLDDIFREHNIRVIDYIDIDVEGMEMDVLSSIDWDEVTIETVLVEQRRMSLQDVLCSDVCNFLLEKGYRPQNKYNRTVIYEKMEVCES